MASENILDINTEASKYIEANKKKLRSLSNDWDDLASEAPQKFMQLFKSGMKPKIERGSSGGRQLNVNLTFEMNTDAAKAYIQEVRQQIDDMNEEFKVIIEEMNKKIQYFYDGGVGAKEFSALVRLFSDFADLYASREMEISKNKISFEKPQELIDCVKKWKDIENVEMRKKEAERLGVDLKDLDTHKKYLESKRRKATAKTSAAMNALSKQFASIHHYLDAASLQAECEAEAKVLKEKEDEAERQRLAEEERRRKEEEARKAEEERQRKEAEYNKAVEIFNACGTVEEYQRVKKQFGNIKDYKDSKDYIEKCKKCIHDIKMNEAMDAFSTAKTEEELEAAAKLFEAIHEKEWVEKCLTKAKEVKCENIYQEALFAMDQDTKSSYQDAVILFNEIIDYKDAKEKIELCESKVKELEIKEEEAKRIAQEEEKARKEKEEAARKEKEKKKKRIMRMIQLVSLIIIIITVAVPYYNNVLKPKMQYNEAVELLQNQQFDEAEQMFISLGSYSDSEEQAKEARYQKGQYLYNQKDYLSAMAIFQELEYYSNSDDMEEQCMIDQAQVYYNEKKYQEAIDLLSSIKYASAAKELYNKSVYQLGLQQFASGKYLEGYETLYSIRNYEDAYDQAKELLYQQGVKFYDEKEFDKANEIFRKLGTYKDSKLLIHEHKWVVETISELTCEQNGEINRSCECGTVENVVTETPGHQFSEATCTEPSACSACGLVNQEALGHTVENQVCTTCGHIIIDAIAFEGNHDSLVEDVYTITVPKGTYRFQIDTKLNNSTSRWSIQVNGSEIYFGTYASKKSGTWVQDKTILNNNTETEIIVKINGSYILTIEPVN